MSRQCDVTPDGGADGFASEPATDSAFFIGKIETVVGSCILTRSGGSAVQIKPGDSVCEGDTIQTAAGGKVCIRFIDGTVFNLSDSARMVLREFAGDVASPSAQFDVSNGTFAFIAGEMAKTGRLNIDTPFASIRGRSRAGGIGTLSLASLFFAAMEEVHAKTPALSFLDDGVINFKESEDYKDAIRDGKFGTVELTVKAAQPYTTYLNDPGDTIVLRQIGSSVSESHVPNSLVQMLGFANDQQQVLQVAAQGQGPTGFGNGGSSTPPPLPPELAPQPINTFVPQPPPFLPPTGGTGGSTSTALDFVPQEQPPPPLPPPPPTVGATIETPNQTGVGNPDQATGTLAFTPVDAGTPTFTWSTGQPLPAAEQTALDGVNGAKLTFSGPTLTDFQFSVPDNLLDFLAHDETLTATYNVTLTDGAGHNLTQPVIITLTGSNDAPMITLKAGDHDSGAVTEHTNVDAGNLKTSGTVSFGDVDLTDTHSVTLVTPNLGALGALTASVTTDDSHTTGTGGVITWQYTVADNAVAYLAEGQTKQETFTISLFDGTSTVKQDVTVTITGTEDKPTITAAAASDSVTEDSLPTTASGTIDFADVDLTDSHTVSATPGGSGYLGAFTPIVSTDSTGDGTGQVTWSFAVNNAELQFLADGQKLTQIYTVTVNDGHTGGTVDQLVTVTITGTNDNPTVSATATTPFTEAADAHAQHLSESGTVNFADIDANDLVSVTSASNNDIAWSGGTLDPTLAAQLVAGFSTGVSNADAPGSTPWNYDVTSANLDFLAAGEKITFSYTVTATDNHGGNGTTTVNFTINGTNDAAVVHADTNWATEDDPNAAGNVLQTIAHTGAPSGTFSDVADTDVDDQATLSVSNIQNANDNVAVPSGTTSANGAVIHGLYGTLKIGADGSYSYQPNDNINNPTGVEDDFTYTVTDGLAPVQSTLKITVFDGPGPTETGTAALTVNEAALDLSKDEADLGAGLVTGSNSSLTTETAQDNALTFTSGSDNIIGVAFSLSILPSVSGAAAGTSFFWMVNGSGQLEGHIGTSASDPLGIILSISGATTANAGGNTASPTITATLTDNFPHAPGSGSISVTGIQVVATDTDGDTATGSASVAIIDDVPTAVADTDSIAAGGFAPATGNVILGGTDAGDANTTDGNADTQGADGAVVSGVAVGNTGVNLDSAATVGNGIHGSYGTLKVNADGSYTYVRDAGSSGGVNDVFTYTIKDGDGDLSHTTLTISIGDSTPSDVIPAAGGATTTVFEKGLPPRGSEPAGSGEIADGLPNNNSDTSETTSGTISFSSPDGISLVSLGGHTLSTSSQTFADGTTGSLTASYIYDPATKLGTISYSYTLLDNTLTDPSSKSFAVVVTDADGDSAPAGNLTISIIDDVPTAVADTDSIAAGGFAPATGNVILGGTDAGDANTTDGNADTQGADGAVVSGVAVGNTGVNLDSAATVGNGIHGSYGTLKVNADGSYTYVRDAGSSGGVNDVFTYTIKDGDGDLSHTTLTISIGDSTPSDVIPAAGGATTTVFEKGLPPRGSEPAGSGEIADGLPNNNSDTSETTSGTISFSSPDGISLVSLGGHTLSTSSQTFADGTTGSLTASYIYDPATKLGTISYSYTLLDNTLTDPSSKSFAVVVTDADGDSAPAGNLTISIIDDVPTATNNTAQASPSQSGQFDLLLVVDVSGSMSTTVTGVPATFGFGNTRIDLERLALLDLVNQANVNEVKIIKFSDSTSSTVWMTKAAAIAYINDANNFQTGGGTNYDTALTAAENAFVTPPTTTSDQRVAYFLSDGEPSSGHAIGSGAESTWITFLGTNGVIKATAIGLGDLTPATADPLEPIAWQSPEINTTYTQAALDPNVEIVNNDNIAALGNTLVRAVPGIASGNLLNDGTPDSFGADGGRILSIQIGTTVYTWNGQSGAGARIDPGTPLNLGDDLVGTSLTNITTAQGGKLTFDFTTGAWTYITPANVTASTPDEVFTYKLVDGDGDQATATLTIDLVSVGDAPQIFTEPGGLIPYWTTSADTGAAQTFINHVSFFDNDIPASVQVTFTSPTVGDVFAAVSGGGVSVSGSGNTITLTGSVTDINAFLAGNGLSWNPAGGSNQVDKTLTVSIDDNGAAPGGNVISKNLILDHKTVSFSGSADNVDFASWNLNQGSATDLINTGNGNDTVVTSWSHGPATQDVGYNGGSGTDTITMVFTPAQLEAILSNSTSESALQTYLDGSIASGDTLNLGATPWNATVTAFENAHLALSAGQTGNVVYGAIDTGGTDANLPDLLAGATGNNSDNTLIGIPAVANTLKGGSTSDTNEASADGNDILVGRDGNDVLWGGGGSDLLLGGDGNDRLHGGNGIDILSGGKGADIFFYSAADANGDGVPTTNADFIVDYSYMDGDKIDLTGLLGSVAGLSVSNVNDYVRIIETPGDPTSLTVQVDLNGTSGGANWVDVTVLDGYRQTSADVVGVGINGTAYIIGDSGVTATASDPIVLDLGAPGISFASANNGVSFDINGDGIKDQVAWTSSNDGILAYDVNGSGTIENGTEIFTPNFAGGNYASGLAALASLDSNADGVINSADTNFGKLLVWQDNNHNGIADPGEVTSLADHGITAINLDATPTDGSIDGQQLQAQGSFSNADGTTGTFVEVALDTVLGTTPDPSTVTSSPDPDQSVATVTETSNPSASESNANASVIGTADDDIIVAAPGNTLIGGSGNDNFVFKAAMDSQPGNGHFDTITDFTHNSDHVDLTAIAGATNVQGPVEAANTVAANSISWFVDNEHNETLLYVNTTAAANHVDMEIHLTGTNINLAGADILHHA